MKTITFNNADDSQHCFETNGSNIVVRAEPRASSSSHGSSMVKLKNIIGYKWEKKNYPGHLIAVHKEGKVIAYSINVNGQGMVRLIHFGQGSKRSLIKGMSKEVLDLQFADYSKEIIIGCIEESALHIHRLDVVENSDSLQCTQLLKIESPLTDHVPKLDKISWCPFVPFPDETETVDEFLLLVWVRGNKFECYSVKTILEVYKQGVHQAKSITEGLVRCYEDNQALITNVTYSPDGTTLAISTADGYIKFYQIYFHEVSPRCLHTWSPHDGAPISSFFFLDNITQPIGDKSLWKYVVTMAANNTEIKVSKCDTWQTLQTITFESTDGQPLSFKAEIDRTSQFLILSDMTNRQMYVLQVLKENALGHQNGSADHQNGNDAIGGLARVFVKTIAKFHLASSVLSYGISNASINRFKGQIGDNYLLDEFEDVEEDETSMYGVVLRMFIILPESLQECNIGYQLLNESEENLEPDLSETNTQMQHLNVSISSSIDSKKNELKTPPQKTSQINLLTPDSFNSPIEKPKDVSQEVLSTIYLLAKTSQATPGMANKSQENVFNLTNVSLIEEEKILQQKMPLEIFTASSQGKSGVPSGGSSPSREVRDILLKADSVNEDYYPGEDSDEVEIEEEQSKDVLNALNALDVDFKNIDDDEDEVDMDDGNEEDDEDEPEIKVAPVVVKPLVNDWPQAPQFVDASSAPATSKQIETLSNRMNQMIDIMEQQSRYIAELRNEIYNLKNETRAEAMVASTNTCKIDENCKKTIEENFARHENILNIRHKQHRELLETITRNQMITIESALKENLLKICTHKAFVESISNSILFGIQYSLETSFKKSLEETMIPSYQKITHEMFQEVAKTFSAGIKEYTRAFDTYMKQYGAVQFQMTEFSGVIHQIPTQVRQTALDAVVPHMNSGFHDIRQRLEKFQSKIIGDVLQQVKNEIQNGFEKQTLSLEDSVLSVVQRSHAETPAPTVYDHQEAIKQLLANGEVNKAFHQALILSDLPLLEFTIEKADYNSVFTGESPCELEQSVLLSLIQQLTADMTKYNELKNRYVSDAVLNLTMTHAITMNHAPDVLRQLIASLKTFLAANPKSHLSSNMNIIIFAAQARIGNPFGS